MNKKNFIQYLLILGVVLCINTATVSLPVYAISDNSQSLVYNDQKVTIVSPYINSLNVYKGNIHSHTTESDGASSPAIVMEQYRDHGYDFNSITDHDKVTVDPGILGIIFLSGIEERAKDTGWAKGVGDIGRIEALLPEISNLSQTILNTGLAESNYNDLKHPSRINNGFFNADLDRLSGYHALEIWNGNNQLNSEKEWDYLLSQNRVIWGDSSDDLHKITGVHMFESWTRVFADTNTATEIKNNLVAGNFYCGYTPAGQTDIIMNVSITDNVISATFNVLTNVEWITDGGIITQTDAEVIAAHYTVVGGEKYIRIRATAGTAKAFSQPIIINLEDIISVTASIVSEDKIYDGSTTAVITTCNLSGINDKHPNVTCLATNAVFEDKNIGNKKNVTATDITLAGTDASWYNLDNTTATTTANITTRSIVIKADDKIKILGEVDPTLTYQIDSGTLIDSDSFVGDLTRIVGDTIGTYTIEQGTVSINNNYNIIFTPGILNIVVPATTTTIATVSRNGQHRKSVGKVLGASTSSIVPTTTKPLSEMTVEEKTTYIKELQMFLINLLQQLLNQLLAMKK